MSIRFSSVVLAALLTVTVAGCGSDAPSGSGAGAEKADRDTAVEFSACMRKNGVTDFPDPDAEGDFEYGVSVSPAVWTKAVGACKDLQPAGTLSGDRSPEEQAAGLRFAQCMRDNGVQDFPDPANGEPLIDTTRIPSTERKGGMAVLNAAIDACRHLPGATRSTP